MKGQISLEYATTYGWALIIMVVIISSLLYYGSIESDTFEDTDCKIGAQFPCKQVHLSSDGVLGIQFKNTINDELTIREVKLLDYPSSVCSSSPLEIEPGLDGTIYCELNEEIFQGDRETIETSINYELLTVNDSSNNKVEFNVNGFISTNVELEFFDQNSMCDLDRDGFWSDNELCGGIDCADNDPNWVEPECTEHSDCNTGEICFRKGKCKAECKPVGPPPSRCPPYCIGG